MSEAAAMPFSIRTGAVTGQLAAAFGHPAATIATATVSAAGFVEQSTSVIGLGFSLVSLVLACLTLVGNLRKRGYLSDSRTKGGPSKHRKADPDEESAEL